MHKAIQTLKCMVRSRKISPTEYGKGTTYFAYEERENPKKHRSLSMTHAARQAEEMMAGMPASPM